jgi:hypothetical protein
VIAVDENTDIKISLSRQWFFVFVTHIYFTQKISDWITMIKYTTGENKICERKPEDTLLFYLTYLDPFWLRDLLLFCMLKDLGGK